MATNERVYVIISLALVQMSLFNAGKHDDIYAHFYLFVSYIHGFRI